MSLKRQFPEVLRATGVNSGMRLVPPTNASASARRPTGSGQLLADTRGHIPVTPSRRPPFSAPSKGGLVDMCSHWGERKSRTVELDAARARALDSACPAAPICNGMRALAWSTPTKMAASTMESPLLRMMPYAWNAATHARTAATRCGLSSASAACSAQGGVVGIRRARSTGSHRCGQHT